MSSQGMASEFSATVNVLSLSSCEAQGMQNAVGKAVQDAYVAGLDVVIQNYDKPIEDLMKANKEAMEKIGLWSDELPLRLLITALHKAVMEEEPVK